MKFKSSTLQFGRKLQVLRHLAGLLLLKQHGGVVVAAGGLQALFDFLITIRCQVGSFQHEDKSQPTSYDK